MGTRSVVRIAACGAALAVLAGCALPPPPGDIAATPWASQSSQDGAADWQHQTFPGKSATRFTPVREGGREALRAHASSSASMLRNKVRIEPEELGRMRFSWKVPQLIPGADLALRDADDSPVRVVLVFEGDHSKFSARDAMLSELVRTMTGEEMPYATLMYVWCGHRAPGSVVHNPRTSRIRTMVVESGPGKLNQWLDYERDIRADYEKAFGEAPGALVGIGIMTDSDNTRSLAQAWYGPIQLARARPFARP